MQNQYGEPFDKGEYRDFSIGALVDLIAFTWAQFSYEFDQMRKPVCERVERDELIKRLELYFSVAEIQKISQEMSLPWEFGSETDQTKVAWKFVDPIWRKSKQQYLELVQRCMVVHPGAGWRRHGKGY